MFQRNQSREEDISDALTLEEERHAGEHAAATSTAPFGEARDREGQRLSTSLQMGGGSSPQRIILGRLPIKTMEWNAFGADHQ
jgi:hypothetical protein